MINFGNLFYEKDNSNEAFTNMNVELVNEAKDISIVAEHVKTNQFLGAASLMEVKVK